MSEFLSWDEGDQEVALVWQQRRRTTHRCGTHPDEWDPDKGGNPDAYHAATLLCPGCQRIEEEQAELDKKKGAGTRGAYVVLRAGPPPSGRLT